MGAVPLFRRSGFMKRVNWILGAACVAAAFGSTTWGDTPTSAVRVEAALRDLHQFVGEGDNGSRWRTFLRSSELAAELSKGDDADRTQVESILSRYSASEPGLQMPQFVAVRSALSAWHGDLVQAQPENLPQLARDAASQFQPASASEIDRSRAQLLAALDQLDALLKNSSPEFEAGWRKYLRWDELNEQARRAEGADPRVVEPILSQFSAYETGLAMRQFAGVRRALKRYLDATLAADPMLQEAYAKNLEALATHLENYEKTGSADDALAASRIVGWLRRHGQAESLASAVSRRFDRPNLYASLSERFLKAGIESDVDRTQGVTDVILGTQIYGTAHTTGRTQVELFPNDRSARFDILLTGQAASSNIGYNGPVTIHSTGLTNISGRKVMVMNEDGLYGYAATANCATSSNIYSIQSCCGLIEKLAWNRAAQQKGQAEAIASSHAAARVAGQMDAEATDLIGDTNRRYAQEVKNPLVSRDAFPQRLEFRTTADQIDVMAVEQGLAGLGAANAPPALAPGHDVSVRAHESALVNFGDAMLGGVTLTDERLEKIIREDLKAEVPEELQITPDKDPWSITFADEMPVRAMFSGGGLSMAIRGRRFTRGDQAVSEPLEISAKYAIEKTATGSKLTRQGEVDVKFLERERLSAQQVAFKTFMTRKFSALFKPEIVSEGIVLKGRLEKAGKLQLQEISSDQGWLAIGWQLAGPPAAEPAAADSAPPAVAANN
jgi:hypothetical protein